MKLRSLADALFEYRRENDLSQEELARLLDISQMSISLLEKGNTPNVRTLLTMSQFFGWSPQFVGEIVYGFVPVKQAKFDSVAV